MKGLCRRMLSFLVLSMIVLFGILMPSSLSASDSSQSALGHGLGIRTAISNAGSATSGSATSMSHSVSSDRSLSQNAVYEVFSVSSSQGNMQSSTSSSAHMQVDESIVSGRASFSVISGGSSPGRSGTGGMMNSAWKDPEIFIEEEYIGTYHISKNFTINESNVVCGGDFWLTICPGGCDPALSGLANLTGGGGRVLPSADDVFDCQR